MTDIDTKDKQPDVIKKTEKPEGSRVPEDPYKKEEFAKFLELLGRHTVPYWSQMAKLLGVDNDTITLWKRHPLAQKVIKDELDRLLEGMEKAGTKDWKMWESRVKMLGISPVDKSEVDVSSLGERIVGFEYLVPKKENETSDKAVTKTA